MRRVGSLNFLESKQDGIVKSADGQRQPTASPLYFFLFHGYGADAYDLQSLSDVIKSNREIHFLFPQGPLEVPIGPGWTGRAWWPIDIMALQQAQQSGNARDLTQNIPPELANLRKKTLESIEAFLKIENANWDQVILGGFSQGSMLATDLFLNAANTPKALVILSGALINKDQWKEKVSARANSPFFMSHGSGDMVLSLSGASQLESLLNNGGMKGSLFSFRGAHEIPMSAITKLNEFLLKI